MGLLSRDTGCQAHHWEPDFTQDDYRIRWHGGAFRVEQKTKFKCAHDGCRESKWDYQELESVGINKDEDGEFHDPNADELMEALNILRAFGSSNGATGDTDE